MKVMFTQNVVIWYWDRLSVSFPYSSPGFQSIMESKNWGGDWEWGWQPQCLTSVPQTYLSLIQTSRSDSPNNLIGSALSRSLRITYQKTTSIQIPDISTVYVHKYIIVLIVACQDSVGQQWREWGLGVLAQRLLCNIPYLQKEICMKICTAIE